MPVFSDAVAYRPDETPRPDGGGPLGAERHTLPAPSDAGTEGSLIDGLADEVPGAATGDPHDDPAAEAGAPGPRASLSDVRTDIGALPEAVRQAREALLGAARSGDIEALRPIFAGQRVAPIVAPFAENDGGVGDVIDHLRLQSGDAEGHEILAILTELLEAGYVSVGEGSAQTYVWPYFAEVPIEGMPPENRVDVYRILTSVDVEEVERLGRYTFFRVGIAPDGRVRYFSAGDLE